MTLAYPLAWIEAVLLASVRIAAFVVVAPPFAHRSIPGRVKAMLSVGLAVAVGPRVTGDYTERGTGAFLGLVLMQVLIGAALGFLVYLVFAAVVSAGNLIDLFGGFTLAQAFDPGSMVAGAQFTRLYQMTAMVLLFATDGYQVVLSGLVRTFDALPLGASLDLASLGSTITEGVTQMFLAALQIAGPLVLVLFFADVGLGLLTRVAPALNAFVLGFPLKILLTLFLSTTAYLALPRIVESLERTSLGALMGVST